MIQRRGLLAGLGALLAAPAIIRIPGILMPVKPLVTPQEVYNEWASERLHLFSTPPGPEGVFWQRWMDHAAKDVEWITGCNEEMLGVSSRERTSVTIEAQRRHALTMWPALDSKLRG